MDKENEQPNKTRGRPKKYFTEEEKKAAGKGYVKKYWDSKSPDDEAVLNHKAMVKLWYHEKMKNPEYVQKERDRKLKYSQKKRAELEELKQRVLKLEQ